ncbi:AAEL004447-PA, partial [Aedes aegypti]
NVSPKEANIAKKPADDDSRTSRISSSSSSSSIKGILKTYPSPTLINDTILLLKQKYRNNQNFVCRRPNLIVCPSVLCMCVCVAVKVNFVPSRRS